MVAVSFNRLDHRLRHIKTCTGIEIISNDTMEEHFIQLLNACKFGSLDALRSVCEDVTADLAALLNTKDEKGESNHLRPIRFCKCQHHPRLVFKSGIII